MAPPIIGVDVYGRLPDYGGYIYENDTALMSAKRYERPL